MYRKRPTEASWDSDDDLLEDDVSGINAFPTDRDEEIDEDALLAGSDDDEMDASKAGQSIVEAIMADELNNPYDHIEIGNSSNEIRDSFDDGPHSSSRIEDEEGEDNEVLDVIVNEEEEQEILGLTAGSDFNDESDMPDRSTVHQSAAQGTPANVINQESRSKDSQEILEAEEPDPAKDETGEQEDESEDSEEEEDDDEKERRGRFKSERTTGVIPLTRDRERTNIPDTLEISPEEQARIDEFEHQKGNRFHRGRGRGGWRGRGGNRGMGPSYQQGQRPSGPSGPAGHPQQGPRPRGFHQQGGFPTTHNGQQPNHQQPSENRQPYQNHNGPSTQPRHPGPVGQPTPGAGAFGSSPQTSNQPRKILINPHFRGALPPGPQFATPTSTAPQPGPGLQGALQSQHLMTNQQQPLRPASMATPHQMPVRPIQAQNQSFQRPNVAWNSQMQQAQTQGMMVVPQRQMFPQQPFPPQQQQRPLGMQQQLRPTIGSNQQQPRPLLQQPGLTPHQIESTPLNHQGPRAGFEFTQAQQNRGTGPQGFVGRGGPTPPYPTEWNRPPIQQLQQQQQSGPRFHEPHQPQFDYQRAPPHSTQHSPRQQGPQQQYQPNQQHFSHPQQQPNGPPRFGQPQQQFGQQHPRFSPPQPQDSRFNSPPQQGPRFGQPGGLPSQRPPFHGQKQRFGSPQKSQDQFKQQSQMEEEAQPIQTVLRGIQQTKPGRGAFSQQQTRPPRPQLTQQQLQRQQRFSQGASGQVGAGLKLKQQLQSRSSQNSMAAKKLQAAKQFAQRQAAQKRASLESPQASPPKQARIVVKTSRDRPVEEMMDADLASKLEEQKKLREQIQRKKEARRQAQASQRRAALMKNLKQQGLTLDDIKDPEEREMMPPPQLPPPRHQSSPIAVQQRLTMGPRPPFTGPLNTNTQLNQQHMPGEKVIQMTKSQYQARLKLGKKVRLADQAQGPENDEGPMDLGPRAVGRGMGRGVMQQSIPRRGAPQAQRGRGGAWTSEDFHGHPQGPGPNFIPPQSMGRGQNFRGRGTPRGGPRGHMGRGGQFNRSNMGGNQPEPMQGPPHDMQLGPMQGQNQNFNRKGPQGGQGQIGQPMRGRRVSLGNQGQGQGPPQVRAGLNNKPGMGNIGMNIQESRNMYFDEGQMQQGPGHMGPGGKRRIVLGGDQKPIMDTVSILHLSSSTAPHQLLQMCSQVGPTKNIQMMQNRATITFVNPEHATIFQRKFNRHMIDLSHISVSLVPN